MLSKNWVWCEDDDWGKVWSKKDNQAKLSDFFEIPLQHLKLFSVTEKKIFDKRVEFQASMWN